MENGGRVETIEVEDTMGTAYELLYFSKFVLHALADCVSRSDLKIMNICKLLLHPFWSKGVLADLKYWQPRCKDQ